MNPFSFKERQEQIEVLKKVSVENIESNVLGSRKNRFDLLIIGGGINGAGIARDAAMRGMKVLLLEARDFASGTSSRSSKMIHGGLRYLENLEFSLVFEALNERHKLFENAPHLVHPLRFLIPLFKRSRVGMLKMGMGMWLYDALSLFQSPELHERLDSFESLQRVPFLSKEELVGSYEYSDASMDDDRLTIETLRSAQHAGASCLNYVEVLDPIHDEKGKIVGVTAVDRNSNSCTVPTSKKSAEKNEFQIFFRHLVSTVGPWTDQLGSRFFPKWKKKLRPTKGIHLTFSHERFPLTRAVVMAAEQRIVFAMPREDMILVGTTDTDFTDEFPENVKVEVDDVQYLLKVVTQYFPGLNIKEKDVLSAYAGVRPLVDDGSDSEGKTSREHTIISDHEKGITFVAGGKYTTYRAVAQQALEKILACFPIEERVKYHLCFTDAPLNPKVLKHHMLQEELFVNELEQNSALSSEECRFLFRRHGPEAISYLEHSEASAWEWEVLHSINNTMCLHLDDFYFRRTPLFLGQLDHGEALIEKIGKKFQTMLHWSDEQLLIEKKHVLQLIKSNLKWRTEAS